MKKRILSLVLCLCVLVSLLPAGVSAADTGKGENCRDLTEAWFGDNPSTVLRLPADIVPRKSSRNIAGAVESYFEAREEGWTGCGDILRKSVLQNGAGQSFSEAVAAFEDRAELRITDARVTAVYDNEHIIAGEDGTYTLFVYEWVFFDYDDLTDDAETADVSGCGISHKIVLSPAGAGYEITSDEYDASELLGICTLNESTKRELEEMNWTGEETRVPDDGASAEDPAFGPERKSVFYRRYSPEACTAYADRYVYNKAQGGTVYESYYNKAYANYNSVGGDCANYTSQCISAGGMPQVKGTAYGTDGWYYSSAGDRSGTWTYVPYLRDWMAANRGVKKAASNSTVWQGSPVFYGDQHAVICVGWNSAGVPVINSHNNDWYHVKWNYYDPGNVTTVQLTPAPGSDPQPEKPALTDFKRSWAGGQGVVFRWEDTYSTTHYNLYIDAMRPDGTWDRNRVVRAYAQSGETIDLPDGVYRVLLQAVNAEESDWPYTDGDSVRFVVGRHTHSRGELVRYEKQHPHPACYRCADCGEVWTDKGSSSESAGCSVCQMPATPALQGPQEECAAYEPVRFTWEPAEKATRYSLYIDRLDEDGTLQSDDPVRVSSGTGCTIRLDAGSYRARLRAENTRCALEDGSGWVCSESAAVSFTVARKVRITFDPDGGGFGDAVRSEAADRVDAGWVLDELSVFTADGETVQTGAGAVEVAVDADGLVTEKRVPGVTEEHLAVPYGGFVLAAGGDGVFPKTAFVNAIVPGDFVAFDRDDMTVYQYRDADAYLARHKSVLPSSAYGSLPVPEKEGCLFGGWLDEAGQPAGYGSAFTSAKLTASWADGDTPPAESVSFGAHRYDRYEYRMSWQDAERFCEARGGHLAVITSFAEQAVVESLAFDGVCAGYFIGCSAPDGQTVWSWVSGEDLSAYGNWESGGPDSSGGRCCAAMRGRYPGQETEEGRWACVPDQPSYPSDSLCFCGFICEYDTASAVVHEHEFTETVSPAGCEKEGYVLRRCACGETEIEVIPPSGHDYKAQTSAPDCTHRGFTAYTCTACGDSYTAEYSDALGHIYADGVCTRCGGSDPGYVPPTDLSELNSVVAGAFRIQMEGFTPGTVSALDEALQRAASAVSGSQAQIDAAAKAVREAVNALQPMPPRLFRDVLDSGRFYYAPVYWAFRANPRITNGADATHFEPGKPCTRAHVVTFLWRAAGCPAPGSTKTGFRDLKSGAFYEKAVAWAVENGITNGVSKTIFDPDAPCTRAQIVTFLWRFKGSVKPESVATSFKDLKPGAYYAKAVAWAVENRVTNGLSQTAFAPDDTCTRGQAVTFLFRASGK